MIINLERRVEMAETKELKEIFEVLTNKKYVRYKPEEKILSEFQQAIDEQTPITLVIGFGYHKNPNSCDNLLPDLAEKTAIQQLVDYADSVKRVYFSGMKIKIITSGRRAEIVNGMRLEDTSAYHSALQEMVKQNNWEEVIEVIPLRDLYEEFAEDFKGALGKAEKEIRPNWDDSFWQAQFEHARRNICREGLNDKEVEEKARVAARTYIIYHRAEVEAKFLEKKFPGVIRGSYNRHEESLVLWTLRKGYITQPWQGAGETGDDGKVVVITQNRKEGE